MKLTVIGTGNMGKALIKGFVGGKVLKGEEITVYDLNKEAANAIASEVGAEVSEDIRKSASVITSLWQ